VTASRLVRHAVIGAEIRWTRACQIDPDLVVAELGEIAFSDVSALWRADGTTAGPV